METDNYLSGTGKLVLFQRRFFRGRFHPHGLQPALCDVAGAGGKQPHLHRGAQSDPDGAVRRRPRESAFKIGKTLGYGHGGTLRRSLVYGNGSRRQHRPCEGRRPLAGGVSSSENGAGRIRRVGGADGRIRGGKCVCGDRRYRLSGSGSRGERRPSRGGDLQNRARLHGGNRFRRAGGGRLLARNRNRRRASFFRVRQQRKQPGGHREYPEKRHDDRSVGQSAVRLSADGPLHPSSHGVCRVGLSGELVYHAQYREQRRSRLDE